MFYRSVGNINPTRILATTTFLLEQGQEVGATKVNIILLRSTTFFSAQRVTLHCFPSRYVTHDESVVRRVLCAATGGHNEAT